MGPIPRNGETAAGFKRKYRYLSFSLLFETACNAQPAALKPAKFDSTVGLIQASNARERFRMTSHVTDDAASTRVVVRKPPEKETAMRECVLVPQALTYACLERPHNSKLTARILPKTDFTFCAAMTPVTYASQRQRARNRGVNEPLDKL